jgi:hypothetical protein
VARKIPHNHPLHGDSHPPWPAGAGGRRDPTLPDDGEGRDGAGAPAGAGEADMGGCDGGRNGMKAVLMNGGV